VAEAIRFSLCLCRRFVVVNGVVLGAAAAVVLGRNLKEETIVNSLTEIMNQMFFKMKGKKAEDAAMTASMSFAALRSDGAISEYVRLFLSACPVSVSQREGLS
jgi:hypothetical protein